MKKHVAALVALAVVGSAGVLYVNQKMDTDSATEQTTTSSTSSYVQNNDSYTQGGVAVNNDVTQSSSAEDVEDNEKEYTFDAEIDNISDTVMTLKVDEDSDVAKSADKVTVNFDEVEIIDSKGNSVKADDVVNFKNVTVIYDGTVMETYPAQVKASKIVLKNRTDCNVYFCLPDGKVIDIVKVPVGADIDSADMPNAGAYCDDGYHFEGWQYQGETVYGMENIEQSVSLTAKIRKD
ncbi:MAG: hypothetical protein IJZ88_01455 [Clostridia bacterium]|nr:hypothetical protein [Clostridia bacterium]